ncbi:MAG TPA: YtxH domain-containing protein [Aggregicoccus sp.]|nr:YtxH domain-containing protein [Aggregicoccus sp.]
MNLKQLQNLDKDRLLELLGLETRRGPSDVLLPALGAFTVGMLVGAGIGLLLAPKPGTQLRDELGRRLKSAQDAGEEPARSEVPAGIASGARTL